MKDSDLDEPDYYGVVERHFVSLRGSPLFISPGEWQLIHRWKEARIPLRVVTEALDRAFERKKPGRIIRRLSYCRQTVEAAFRRFREAIAGTGVEDPAERAEAASRVASYLREAIESVRTRRADIEHRYPALAAALGDCAVTLEELSAAPCTAERLDAIERELARWDDTLCETARRSLEAEERERLRRHAERSLGDYRERMPEDVYRSAVESAVRKELRKRFALPALSLFYL